MTIGTISDTVGWTVGPHTGLPIGHRYVKTWQGQDDPPLPPLPKRPPSYIHRAYLNNIYDVRKIRVGNGPRPRRQKRHVDRHTYSMSSDRRNANEWAFLCPAAGSGTFYAHSLNYIPPMPSASTLVDANFQLNLLGKLKAKVQGSEFNLAIFLGEGHESLRMVADSATRIAKSIFHLRKGDLAGATRSLIEGTSRTPLIPYKRMKPLLNRTEKSIYSNWLELQYGWSPLLEDTKAGMEYVAHILEVPFQKVVKVTGRREANYEQSFAICQSPLEGKSSGTLSYRRVLTAVLSTVPQTQAQRLGLLDPLSLAWELLPFSFVADWFIPIGQFLEANAFVSGLTQQAWTTNLSISESRIDSISISLDSPPTRVRAVQFDRTVGTSFDVPFPNIKPLGKAASWQHAANAVALLGSMFR